MRTWSFRLSLLLIFTIAWEDAFAIGSLGSVARAVGLIAAGLWAATVLLSGSVRRPTGYLVAAYLFVLWNLASSLWTLDWDLTLQRLVTYSQLFVLIWMLWDLFRTREQLRAGLQAYVLGCYVLVFTTFYHYFSGVEIGPYAAGEYSGAGLNADDLALTVALALPVACYLLITSGSGRLDRALAVANGLFIPAAAVTTLLSATRMALVADALACAYVVTAALGLKLRWRVPVLWIMGVGVAVSYFLLPAATIGRLATIGSSIASADLGGRGALWRDGLALFADRPLLGIGSGSFTAISGTVVHNTFLSVLVEGGLVGFALFAAVLAIVARSALSLPRREALFWLAVLAIWSVGVFTLTWEYRKTTWLLLTLVVVAATVQWSRQGRLARISVRARRSSLARLWRVPQPVPAMPIVFPTGIRRVMHGDNETWSQGG